MPEILTKDRPPRPAYGSDTPITDAACVRAAEVAGRLAIGMGGMYGYMVEECCALERELSRYKRLEAILRDRSDVVDVKDSYNEVRANAEMQALQDWEAGE